LDLAQKLLRRAAALLPAFTLPVTGAFNLLPVARLYFALPFAVSFRPGQLTGLRISFYALLPSINPCR
jgi:hypothetical protein